MTLESVEGQPRPDGFNPKKCSMSHFGLFWVYAALAIGRLRERMLVEVIVDEMAATFDRIRYDTLEYRRDDKGKQPRFPKVFHRIHMSNVPCVASPTRGAPSGRVPS